MKKPTNTIHQTNLSLPNNELYGINEAILYLLISKEKVYLPSEVAKICNRSLSSDSIDDHTDSLDKIGIPNAKGVLLKIDIAKCLQTAQTDIDIGDFLIKGMIFPGFYNGKEIYNKLDNIYNTIIEKATNKNIYTIASFFLIMVTTINGFLDGNGRTSICLAKYIIDRFGNKKISLLKLEESIDQVRSCTTIATILLMPKEILRSAQNEHTGEINILESFKNNHKMIRKFLDSFSDDIIGYINKFSSNLSTGDEYIDQYIDELASLLKESSL